MEDEQKLTCCFCGNTEPLDAFDVCGACPGNVYCNQCCNEIDVEFGMPAPLCGVCDACDEIRKAGQFKSTQECRIKNIKIAQKRLTNLAATQSDAGREVKS